MLYKKSFLLLFLVLGMLVFLSNLSMSNAKEKQGMGSGTVLISIAVRPDDPHKAEEMALQFKALGRYSDHTVQDITTQVTWTSSDTTVAWIDSATGLAVGLSAGISTITATSGSIKGFTTLRVVSTAVPRISVFPANGADGNINQGYSQQFTAVHTTHTGKIRDLTNEVIWKSSNPAIATINSTGLATSLATGTTLITAAIKNHFGATLLKVNPPFDACQTTSCCVDTDGDGLCDEWEIQGYIDVNGNGIYDAGVDVQLPGSDPNKPDIYVYYDWMDYAMDGESCGMDFDCYPGLGLYHGGETCSAQGQCIYSCTADSDCTSRWPTEVHAGERCINDVCQHTHDPLVLDVNAFQPVIAQFAAHDINLHILRGNAVPHSHVVSFRSDAEMDLKCEGASLSAGTVGLGKYAVSFYDFKPNALKVAYHYLLFGHYVGCDAPAHCPANAGISSSCPDPTLSYGQTGMAELSGNYFIVSLGGLINNTGSLPHFQVPGTFMHELGHNLGLRHDGHHDTPCSSSTDCRSGDTCLSLNDGQGLVCHESFGGLLGAEEPNYKPNYLSIMNYLYEASGIQFAAVKGSRVPLACSTDADCGHTGTLCVLPPANSHCFFTWHVCTTNSDCTAPGDYCVSPTSRPMICSISSYVCQSDSDCNAGESCVSPSAPGTCARLDYSRQTLPAGGPTPGALDESNLNDSVGLGSGTTDIFYYTDAFCHFCPLPAPTDGPVNWMGTGLAVNSLCDLFRIGLESFTDVHVQADIDTPNGICSGPTDVLHGHTDWPDLSGIPFNYKFQCTPAGEEHILLH